MKTIHFVDDTDLVPSDNNFEKFNNSVKREMAKVADWLTAKTFSLYISETKCRLITNRHVNTGLK